MLEKWTATTARRSAAELLTLEYFEAASDRMPTDAQLRGILESKNSQDAAVRMNNTSG